MLDLGANDYNRTMISAAIGGQLEIVQWALNKGATKYSSSIYCAANGGHQEIVNLILQHQQEHQ